MRLVLDTNILIAATIRDGMTRRILEIAEHSFLLPENALMELAAHKDEIVQRSGLSVSEFEHVVHSLLEVVEIVPEQALVPLRKRVLEIVGMIDPDDAAFIAYALLRNACLWSNDERLKQQH